MSDSGSFGVLVTRLARCYEAEGRPWPAFCASLTMARGLLGLDRAELARRLGVAAHVVVHLEAGLRHPSLAPPNLGIVAPEVNWAGLGVPPLPPTGHSLGATRDRHPAARRPARVLVSHLGGQ